MKRRRVCCVSGCTQVAKSRGHCNRHYLQRWEAGGTENIPVPPRSCLVCGEEFVPHYGAQLCGKDCQAVRSSKRASERKGMPGTWEAFRSERKAQALARRLHREGFRQVPKRRGSAVTPFPHFACWRVGELYVVKHYDRCSFGN